MPFFQDLISHRVGGLLGRLSTGLMVATLACGWGMSFSTVCAQAGGVEGAASLAPPPPDQELAQAHELVEQLFQEEIRDAKSPAQWQVLGQRLIQAGLDTKDDSAGRFASLQKGAQYAARGGDLLTACRAIDALAKEYAIDSWTLKRAAAELSSKAPRLPKQHEAQCGELAALVAASTAADRHAIASELSEILVRSASASREPALIKAAQNLAADIKTIAAEHERITAALAREQAGEATADDLLAIGRFLCLFKGDWTAGLPTLASGTAGPVQQLAGTELTGPTEAADQLELADQWWDLSQTLTGIEARRMRRRAAGWYERAAPRLTGISAAKAKKRIETAAEEFEAYSIAPAVAASRPTASAAVDLLAQFRERPQSQHMLGGRWTDSKEGIVSTKSAYARLAFPTPIKRPYELDVEFNVVEPDDACIGFVLPVHNRQTFLCIDGWGSRGSLTYLCNVNGREAPNNPKAVRGKHLKKGTVHRAHVAVDWNETTGDARVTFELDGKRVFEWRGKSSELSVQKGWELPKQDAIGLGAYTTQAEFLRVTLTGN
jgi:hypothetical protein